MSVLSSDTKRDLQSGRRGWRRREAVDGARPNDAIGERSTGSQRSRASGTHREHRVSHVATHDVDATPARTPGGRAGVNRTGIAPLRDDHNDPCGSPASLNR
jgi:hypothetical protein